MDLEKKLQNDMTVHHQGIKMMKDMIDLHPERAHPIDMTDLHLEKKPLNDMTVHHHEIEMMKDMIDLHPGKKHQRDMTDLLKDPLDLP